MEDITDAGYMHAKGLCKNFKIKHLGEYHDLYLKAIYYFWLMFLKISEKICLLIYHLGPGKFLSAPGLA